MDSRTITPGVHEGSNAPITIVLLTGESTKSRYEPTARSLDVSARHLNDVTSFRREPLARAETQTGKDTGVRRALGLMLDALDEVIP